MTDPLDIDAIDARWKRADALDAPGPVIESWRDVPALVEALRGALARLGAVRDYAAHLGHGDECPAGEHEECDPDVTDGDGCDRGLQPDQCRARRGDCACGRDRLWMLVAEEPASDARTLGEAQSTAERMRAKARRWEESAARHAESSARFQRELAAERRALHDLRVEVSAALGLPPTIGPAPGELARIVRETREALDVALRGACPRGYVFVTQAQADDAARAKAELDAAWRTFPSAGAVRGMVSLADVVTDLVEARAELTQERDALRAAARRVAEAQRGADLALTDLFSLVPAEEVSRG